MLWGSWRALAVWAAPSVAESAADAGVLPRRRCRVPGGSLEGTGERASAWRGSAGEQGSEMGRDEGGSVACRRSARACKTCALGAPRARMAGARRNASAF